MCKHAQQDRNGSPNNGRFDANLYSIIIIIIIVIIKEAFRFSLRAFLDSSGES